MTIKGANEWNALWLSDKNTPKNYYECIQEYVNKYNNKSRINFDLINIYFSTYSVFSSTQFAQCL